MVAVCELDLELDTTEEGGRRVEDEPIRTRSELGRKLWDAAVVVRGADADCLVSPEELDEHADGGPTCTGVEDVGRDGDAHAEESTTHTGAAPSGDAK